MFLSGDGGPGFTGRQKWSFEGRRAFVKKFLVSMLLGISLLLTAQVAAAENGLDAAFQMAIHGPLRGGTAGRRIFGLPRMTTPGMVVEGWRCHVTLPQIPGFLLFVDDEPEANWEHPARLVFVNPVDGGFAVYDYKRRPRSFPSSWSWENMRRNREPRSRKRLLRRAGFPKHPPHGIWALERSGMERA